MQKSQSIDTGQVNHIPAYHFPLWEQAMKRLNIKIQLQFRTLNIKNDFNKNTLNLEQNIFSSKNWTHKYGNVINPAI